jgi:hypothetical protein
MTDQEIATLTPHQDQLVQIQHDARPLLWQVQWAGWRDGQGEAVLKSGSLIHMLTKRSFGFYVRKRQEAT